jgi:hypothetical protein
LARFAPFAAAALAALAALAIPEPARAADAAAPWPTSAQGRALPRPAWVLVIPARRRSDGTLSIWERTDAWTRAWRVPKNVRGIGLVTLLGDAEDRRAVTAAAIDGMMVDSLSVVMRKYGAPALALAVTDGSSVALAGYVPGYAASWIPADAGPDLAETRSRTLPILASLFSSGGAPPPKAPAEEADAVEIVALRDRDDGGVDYRIALPPGLSGGGAEARLDGVAGLSVTEVTRGRDGREIAVLSGVAGQDELVAALRGRGITVR